MDRSPRWLSAATARPSPPASNDGTGRLWDAATGTPIGRPLRHQAQVSTVAFSPDGKTVATGSNDTTCRLWNVAAAIPAGHAAFTNDGAVFAATFSPDGKMVLTGCADNAARLWEATTGQPIGRPMIHPG